MIINKFFRLYAPEPDASGTGTAVDRGDLLEDDINPDDPDGDLEAKETIKDDPKVKELESEIKDAGPAQRNSGERARVPRRPGAPAGPIPEG